MNHEILIIIIIIKWQLSSCRLVPFLIFITAPKSVIVKNVSVEWFLLSNKTPCISLFKKKYSLFCLIYRYQNVVFENMKTQLISNILYILSLCEGLYRLGLVRSYTKEPSSKHNPNYFKSYIFYKLINLCKFSTTPLRTSIIPSRAYTVPTYSQSCNRSCPSTNSHPYRLYIIYTNAFIIRSFLSFAVFYYLWKVGFGFWNDCSAEILHFFPLPLASLLHPALKQERLLHNQKSVGKVRKLFEKSGKVF